MAVYEAIEPITLVYTDEAEDLREVGPDPMRIKHAFIVTSGVEFMLPPGSDTWEQINNDV